MTTNAVTVVSLKRTRQPVGDRHGGDVRETIN